MLKRNGLKSSGIGQSAAKHRLGEGSTTIPNGSRIKRSEVVRSVKTDEDIVCSFVKAKVFKRCELAIRI